MTTTGQASNRVAFGLGANVGDRLSNLQLAVDTIVAEPGVDVVAVSAVYETTAVGGPEQADYLNAVLVAESTLAPLGLLELAQRCEATAGRVRTTRWGPRPLDVDVLAVGGLAFADSALTLPHPRIRDRAFVLKPWADVDPDFTPGGDETVAELLAQVSEAGVRRSPVRLRIGM